MSKVKKTLCILLAIMILAFSVILFASADATNHIGDIDNDGKISAADARLALRASVGLEKLTDTQFKSADVNKDNKVTASDARTILRVSVGLEEFNNNEEKQAELDRIMQINNGEMPEIQIDEQHGVPNYISGKFSSIRVENSADAISALNDIKAIMNITDANLEFKVDTVNELLNIKQYNLQQYYDGIKVYGNILKVNCDFNGDIVSLIGSYTPNININFERDLIISENEAKDIIINKYPNNEIFSSELIIYDLSNENNLVWKIVIGERIKTSSEIISVAENTIFLSATNGEIVGSSTLMRSESYNGVGIDISGDLRKFIVEKENNIYYMTDLSKGIYLCTYNNKTKNPEQITSSDNTWNNRDSVSLMANLSDVVDYYKRSPTTAFNNNKLSNILGYVQYGKEINNAYSSTSDDKQSTFLKFGDVTPRVGAIDTVAHEFTHSIISATCDLEYLNQSGAINEAYCDILGNLIENDNNVIWLHGEDHTAGGIRNLSDPNAFEQPDRVNGKYMHDYCFSQHDHSNANCDYGGVHTNSGIINKCAYLIWTKAISNKSELAKLFIYSLDLMSSNANFLDCRNAIVEAAQQLGYEQDIIKIIKYCFISVGIVGNEIIGIVKDMDSYLPIADVKITCNELGIETNTDSNGIFCLKVDELSKQHTFNFAHDKYKDKKITIASNSYSSLAEVHLTPKCGTVTGTVTDSKTGKPISKVSVEAIDNENGSLEPVAIATTDANGKYSLTLPYGSYSLSFNHENYEYYGTSLSVNYEAYEKNATLSPKDTDSSNDNTGDSGDTEERTVIDSGNCGADGDNVTWTLYEDGELVISGSGAIQNCYYLGQPWYSYRESITNITIKDGVTSISLEAFKHTAVKEVVIPGSVKIIGESAFENCDNLISVKINSGVKTIGSYAFSGCKSLETIEIPGTVKVISMCAFSRCNSLKNIELNRGIEKIEAYVFSDTAIEKIILPNTIKTLFSETRNASWPSGVYDNTSCFKDAYCLNEVIFEHGVTIIPSYSFHESQNMSVIIPDSVTVIGKGAFESSCVENISLPDSIITIKEDAFYNSNIKKINLGSLTNIEDSVPFLCCNNLISINVDKNNQYFSSENGVLFNKDKTILMKYPDKKEETSYSIPKGVTSIYSYAFENSDILENLSIPDSITNIGYGFYTCNNLTSINVDENNQYFSSENGILFNKDKTILMHYPAKKSEANYTIPNSVTSIAYKAFDDNTSITNIIMSDNVIEVCSYAFYGCKNLVSIRIPNSVTTIDYAAFYNCVSLTDVYYTGTQEEWSNITVDYSNNYLTNATIHYNS